MLMQRSSTGSRGSRWKVTRCLTSLDQKFDDEFRRYSLEREVITGPSTRTRATRKMLKNSFVVCHFEAQKLQSYFKIMNAYMTLWPIAITPNLDPRYYYAMRSRSIRPYVCPSLSGKNGWGMEIEKVRWDVGRGWRCRQGWLGCEGKWKGETLKHVFRRPVHYFRDIHQGALQSIV